MSSRSTHWCWVQYDVSAAELLLLLAISERCNWEGNGSYQKVATLAHKARQSERNVQRLLKELEVTTPTRPAKIKRTERPARTTLIQLLIPADFGRGAEGDNLAPLDDEDSEGGAASGAGPTKTPRGDNLAPSIRGDNPSPKGDELAPKGDNLAPDSSSSYSPSPIQEKTRARTGEGPGAPRAQDESKDKNQESRLFLLNNTARNLGVTPKMPTETLEQFDRRLSNETLHRNQEILKQRAGGG